MYSSKGEIFILDHDHIINNQAGGRCFAYQLEGHNYLNKTLKNESTGHTLDRFDRGSRIDSENQNFIVVRNLIHLGHSYLGILINEQNSEKEYTERVFDPLAYPYYFNQQTELMHLVSDAASLEQLLSHYEESDKRILDHILLIDKKMKTPLHYATDSENSRSLNMLLKKLSLVQVNNTSNFKDIFEDFLDYFFFKDYLNTCFFKTVQMKAIQSLSIPQTREESDIGSSVVIQNTNTFISQELINSVQDQKSPSQPVTVQGFDLHWILNTPKGKSFLHKLSQLDNYDFFTTEFIRTIIYFLWRYFKLRIIIWIMIPYCAYFSLFIALVFYNESYFQDYQMQFQNNQMQTMIGLCVALFVIIMYFFYILIRTCHTLGWSFIKSFWVWLTFGSNILNLTIVIMTLSQAQPLNIRRIESAAVLIMWIRSLYFFRILDSTAPLIRMIQQILYDMRSFIFILFLFVLAFANSFYVLAQNSNYTNPGNSPPYVEYMEALTYVYQSAIGNIQTGAYGAGTADSYLLNIFLPLTTFMIMIVLLNMLIAMMGQSFSTVSAVAEASMLRERILLIMENFFLRKQGAFSRAKYLIAFAPVQDDGQDDMMQKMMDKINSLTQQGKDMSDSINIIKDSMSFGGYVQPQK